MDELDYYLLSNKHQLDKMHDGFKYTKMLYNSQIWAIWKIYYGEGEKSIIFNIIMTIVNNNAYYKLYKYYEFGSCICDNIVTLDHVPFVKLLETSEVIKIIDILRAV